jgi:beta-mannosidase
MPTPSKSGAGHTHQTPRFSVSQLCTALFVVASLPLTDALHHMAVKAPRKPIRRKLDITPLLVTNRCPEPIWPGIGTQSGKGPNENGFKLEPGETKNQTVSEDWQGRVWGRTNCTFNSDGTAPAQGSGKACKSGDCNGALNCAVGVSDGLDLNNTIVVSVTDLCRAMCQCLLRSSP